MLIRWFLAVLGVCGALLVAGCSTTSTGAAAQSAYQPPDKGAEIGTIKGTRRRLGFLADDHYGYVLLVDRKFISNPRKGWDKPVPLTAGRHTITAEYTYGPYTARADIVLEVKAGTSYQLMVLNGTEGADGSRFNDFWIVDSSGKVVSQVYHATISGGNSNYNPFSVN
jgi:hypothetical protein